MQYVINLEKSHMDEGNGKSQDAQTEVLQQMMELMKIQGEQRNSRYPRQGNFQSRYRSQNRGNNSNQFDQNNNNEQRQDNSFYKDIEIMERGKTMATEATTKMTEIRIVTKTIPTTIITIGLVAKVTE